MTAPGTGREPGWWSPEPLRPSTRFHYVGHNGNWQSLCGKWLYISGMIEPEDGPSPDDCRACRKKLSAILGAPGDGAADE